MSNNTDSLVKGNENLIMTFLGIILTAILSFFMWFKNRKTEKQKSYFTELRRIENNWKEQHNMCCNNRVLELNRIYDTIKEGNDSTKEYFHAIITGDIIEGGFKNHEKRIEAVEKKADEFMQMKNDVGFMKDLFIKKFGD